MIHVILPFLTAIALSGIAAYYSVIGLAQIFPGSYWPIIIMGSVLEAAKLVTVSWVYNHWKNTFSALKLYFLIAVVLLMGITSMGIFGYLSKAHIEHSSTVAPQVAKVEIYEEKIKALPVQFIRGKTIDDILIVEEAQNLTKGEMLAILTRLGKTGKIVINGDNEQSDIKTSTGEMNGLSYAIELSKKIEEIKWIKLKENHRSDLVGKILEYEYGK
mgnify:CR=1 FL=1